MKAAELQYWDIRRGRGWQPGNGWAWRATRTELELRKRRRCRNKSERETAKNPMGLYTRMPPAAAKHTRGRLHKRCRMALIARTAMQQQSRWATTKVEGEHHTANVATQNAAGVDEGRSDEVNKAVRPLIAVVKKHVD